MIHRILRRLLIGLFDLVLLLYWYPVRKLFQALPQKLVFKLTGFITSTAVVMLPGIKKRLEPVISAWFPGVYSNKEINEIACRSIVNYAGRRLEEIYIGSINKEQIDNMVSVSGWENIEESVKRGNGTIILTSHFGSFLLPLLVIGFKGYRINQLAGPPILKHHRSIHEMIFKLREKDYERLPVTFLHTGLHLKTAIKSLKNNELLTIAFDGREGDKWAEVNFLDKKAFFSPGPLRMAQATGASIVPTFIIRQKDHTHHLIFKEPVIIEKTREDEQAFLPEMQKLVDVFDDYVRSYPCHAIITMYIAEQRAKTGSVSKPIFA
jgi:lauroyl/myristoyl acyltransferase